jgi:hypothetical protein
MIFVVFVSLLFIPLVVGKAVIAIVHKNHKNDYVTFISSNMVEWLVGILIIYLIAAVLFTFNVLNPEIFAFGIIILPTIYLILRELRVNHWNSFASVSLAESVRSTFGNKLVIPIILLAGLLPLIYLVPGMPFPLSPITAYGRIRLSLEFINGGTMELVHGYSFLLSPIQSLSAIIYGLHPLQVLGATKYLMHILFPFSLYLLSYKLTKDSAISLVPAFIGPWFFLGGSAGLTSLENTSMIFLIFPWILYAGIDRYSPFPLNSKRFSRSMFLLALAIVFLSPITYAVGKGGSVIPPTYFVFLSIFLPIILIGVYYALNFNNSHRIGVLITFIIPFMLIEISHPYIGTLVVFFLTCFFFAASASSEKTLKILRISSIALTAFALILIFFRINGPDNFMLSKFLFPNLIRGLASDLTVQQKWATFLDFGPALMVYIFLALVFLIGLFGHKKYVSFIFASSVMLFLTFIPEGNFWRSEMFLNPIAAVLLAYALIVIWKLLNLIKFEMNLQISHSLLNSALRKIKSNSVSKMLFVALVLVILLPIVQIPRMNYYSNPAFSEYGEGYISYVQTYDINCSFWILNNYKTSSVLIISDPATMYYVGSLTAKDTLMTMYSDPFPPEAYGSSTWTYMDKIRREVFLHLGENGSRNRTQEVASIIYPQFQNYDRVLFVVTPHTYYWLYENNTFPTRVKIMPINDAPIIQALFNDVDFNLLYKEGNVLYVYELQK